MSYHLTSRRAAQHFVAPAKNFASEVRAGNEGGTGDPVLAPRRMALRWSAAGARYHARFAETARKTFT